MNIFHTLDKDQKISLNQFLTDIVKKIGIVSIIFKINFKENLAKYPKIQIFQTM